MTSFSQADGFIEIDRAGRRPRRRHATRHADRRRRRARPTWSSWAATTSRSTSWSGALAERGFTARTIAVGSLGGVAAASRGECDLAPVHLVDPKTGALQQASARARAFAGARLAAHAGRPVPAPATRASKARPPPLLKGRARRSVVPDGQPQRRRRHPRADRQLGAARGRRATPTSRARTMPSPPPWRRRAPIGAWRSSRWRGSTASAFCRFRAGALRFPAGREPATVSPCGRSSPRCATSE